MSDNRPSRFMRKFLASLPQNAEFPLAAHAAAQRTAAWSSDCVYFRSKAEQRGAGAMGRINLEPLMRQMQWLSDMIAGG